MVKALRWVDGGAVSEAVERIHGWWRRGGNGQEDGARRRKSRRHGAIGDGSALSPSGSSQSFVAGSVGIGLTTFVARLVFVQIYPESSA